MKYRVHRLEVKEETAQEQLENFLNRFDGEIISVIPFTTPKLKRDGCYLCSKIFSYCRENIIAIK